MKAYLIDPVTKRVSEVDYNGNLDDIYAKTRCECITSVHIDRNNTVYVNDNGLIDGTPQRFGMFVLTGNAHSVPLAGYGLVVGTTRDGEDAPVTVPLAEVQAMVTFPSLAEIRMQAAQGVFD